MTENLQFFPHMYVRSLQLKFQNDIYIFFIFSPFHLLCLNLKHVSKYAAATNTLSTKQIRTGSVMDYGHKKCKGKILDASLMQQKPGNTDQSASAAEEETASEGDSKLCEVEKVCF